MWFAQHYAALVILVIASGFLHGADQVNQRPEKAMADADRLVNDRPLELSLREQSASTRFYFVCEALRIDEGLPHKHHDVVVARDGERVAALVRYADGLPHCYMSDDLMVVVDPATNRLKVIRGGRTHFILRAGGDEFDVGFVVSRRNQRMDREFVADFKSILDTTKRSRSALFDPGAESLQYTTERSSVRIDFNNQPESKFAINRLTVQGRAGILVWPIIVGEKAKHPLNLFKMSVDSLKLNGVVFDEIDEATVTAKKAAPTPKENAVENAELRAVLEKWESTFRTKGE